ncbi:aldose 1-epimerase [Paenibacillus doosanensis]|uniref:Aldose 1-epimerase n=1 Tax=Paenibacillus konkukensis TaxID=2020716 RepID=A0ABY4RL25_9BACL|nr:MULTISPECIES: aldose 1-epimerase [Paenibacillus]MCS7464414.1 aldose 1-epimerase [Paenibacillus doosanensis]UQZ82154.1 Aldose 1-epimerase [Paenibacillus konkukensis]
MVTTESNAYEGLYQGERAIWLTYGRYEAAVLPEIGGNLIAFRDTDKQYRFLHEPTPEEMESFKEKPIIHGIPVLFPPNRYEDGKFPWNGKCYEFPVNEPSTGNHLHGFLHNIPWSVEHFGADKAASRVTLVQKVDAEHPVYRYFPHEFTIRLSYTLSELGLQQQVAVRNDGGESMPCLLAFHTSINAPFATGSTAADYRFTMTTGQRWELNERMLPTGRYQELTPDEERMKSTGISPFFEAMDNHYTAVPQQGRNRMELTDTRAGVTLVYDVGTAFKHWMIWNNNATEGFFCPEPQINLVNAPSVQLPSEQIGLFALEPGEIWEASGRLYCISRA